MDAMSIHENSNGPLLKKKLFHRIIECPADGRVIRRGCRILQNSKQHISLIAGSH